MAPAVRPLLPGILLVLGLTAVAFALAPSTRGFGLGATALAVLLGLVVGNLVRLGPLLGAGVAWSGRRFLTVAVVLLGLFVTLRDLAGSGVLILLVVVGVVFGAMVLALLLGRALGVPPALAGLIGAGTGVCGVSAIAAARAAVGAREDEVSYAVASVTFLGSLGLVVYPLVQLAVHPLGPEAYGVLSGATLHSVPQAVGAGFVGGGDVAGAVATVTKLARVALLGPLVFVLALAFRTPDGPPSGWRVPVEVWGFLTLFVLGSLVRLPSALLEVVAVVDEVLLVAALAALGLLTRFSELKRAGVAPLLVAVVVWVGALVVLVPLLRHLV